jgi:maltokinase
MESLGVHAALFDALRDDLARWIKDRRWFAAKESGVTGIQLLASNEFPLEGVRALHWVIEVQSPGRQDLYQILVALTRDASALSVEAIIGNWTDEGITWIVSDLLAEPSLLSTLPEYFSRQIVSADLQCHCEGEFPLDQAARTVSSEQSNTSVIFGDNVIIKFYRRLNPGVNPDLEVGLALTREGSPHIAEVLGWISGDINGEPTTMAIAHRFLPTAIDGFEHALTSVRDLIASEGISPEDCGGDFAGEALRLGEAVAEVHARLRAVFPVHSLTTNEAERIRSEMERKLDLAIEEVPELSPFAPSLRAIYSALRSEEVSLQRVHGDLHLGQVLRDPLGWVILDFEGEPGTPMADRRQFSLALRDVAGMLRSFDYAARQPLIDRPDIIDIQERTAAWAERNREHFLRGYLSHPSSASIEHLEPWMRALEAEKAVYESVYERRFRPSWISVPLNAIARLTEGVA